MVLGLILVAFSLFANCNSLDLLSLDEVSNPGEESPGTVYKAGQPGANWTPEEIDFTRQRILQAITPIWPEKIEIGTATHIYDGRGRHDGEMTENVLMRLAFHDCIPYLDGGEEDRACDGCLNFQGMFDEVPSANQVDDVYRFKAPTNTNNQHLGLAAVALERIYKTIDWPFAAPIDQDLTISLHQSGKSRADLWQFAGMVALELTIERANRACDLDFHIRQQITILESRNACEIKLKKPLKFVTGRIDCDNNDEVIDCIDAQSIEDYDLAEAGFVTCKKENQPELMADGKSFIDYGTDAMNMDADKWMAVQAIHSAVHAAQIGQKYTWFGSGYLGNMYFKMIANHPTYKQNQEGGDLTLTSCEGNSALENRNIAVGGTDGKPMPMTGWRASCGYVWDTPEGGPCVLRPVLTNCPDNPHWDDPQTTLSSECYSDIDKETGEPSFGKYGKKLCKDAEFVTTTTETGYEFNLLKGGKAETARDLKYDDKYWKEPNLDNWNDLAKKTQTNIQVCAWSNQFAFPWEIGMYWNLTVGGAGKRAMGCPGLDDYDYGVVNPASEWTSAWPFYRPQKGGPRHSFQASPAMRCGLTSITDSFGVELHEIIDEMANDNENFASRFLEGWHQMTTNGYSDSDLVNGPDNGWLGHYSLTEQGKTEHLGMNFEDFVSENGPVIFTDPKADPYICGHRGHSTTSCGIKFSQFFKKAAQPGSNACDFKDCIKTGICD